MLKVLICFKKKCSLEYLYLTISELRLSLCAPHANENKLS